MKILLHFFTQVFNKDNQFDASKNSYLYALISALVVLGLSMYLLSGSPTIESKFTAEKTLVANLDAPCNHPFQEAGIAISSPHQLGTTKVEWAAEAVSLNGQSSIRRVVNILPQLDEQLEAELVFQYKESELLYNMQEEDLQLYSSTDKGKTWQAHPNSNVDTELNIVHLEGVMHLSSA